MGFADITDTFSDISAFSNPYGVPAKAQWNLNAGEYTNSYNIKTTIFFETTRGEDPNQKTALEQTSDNAGRRLAIYEYPYIDGQRVDDLGRKGETFTFNLKFFGTNYQNKLQEFIKNIVNDNGQGGKIPTLLHPAYGKVRGAFNVRFRDYEFVHRHDEWNAVTIKATFIEDNTGEIQAISTFPSPDSKLRSLLQQLTNIKTIVNTGIFQVGALLKLPKSLLNSLDLTLSTIVSGVSGILGQLAATFSSHSQTVNLATQSSNVTGGTTALTSGSILTSSAGALPTASSGSGTQVQLPPVYQVGLDPATLTLLNEQITNFINANQITPSQAVFKANQLRQSISAAIADISKYFGNQGYGIVLEYRAMANAIQDAVQACVAATQLQVVTYTVPSPMSLRMVAKLNGLTPDRQNDISNLNPDLPSINWVPAGTLVTVPAS